MKTSKKTQLTAYLATGLAAATAGQADAATVVTFYGPGARTPTSNPATPDGIDFGTVTLHAAVDSSLSTSSYFLNDYSLGYFSSGADMSPYDVGREAPYYFFSSGIYINGAQNGDQNYANISFDGNDGVYEAVGQFYFEVIENGYLVALAINDDGSALSISDGKAAIDAIPEPNTAGLLALGAAGLAMLRRRKRDSAPSS